MGGTAPVAAWVHCNPRFCGINPTCPPKEVRGFPRGFLSLLLRLDALLEVLEQLGEPEATPDSSALGAGGKISLKFQAVQTGQASLALIYHRSFEKDVPPEKTFEVTILVK